MQDYLQYYPQFDLYRELSFKVIEEGAALDEHYHVPTELTDAASNLAADLYEKATFLYDYIEDLMQELVPCIQKNDHPKITLEQYLDALKEDDRVVMWDYETYHGTDLKGCTQAEVYFVLSDLLKNTGMVKDYINNNLLDPTGRTIDEKRENEKKRYVELAYWDWKKPGSVNKLPTAYEAQLKYQVDERLDFVTTLANECRRIASFTIKDTCGNGLDEVISTIVSSDFEIVNSLKILMEVGFKKLGGVWTAFTEQEKIMANSEVLQTLQESTVSLRRLRFEEVNHVLDFLKTIDTKNDTAPSTVLLKASLPGMQAVDKSLDTTILDLSKAQNNDFINKTDILANISSKKQLRQLIRLTENLLNTVDFDDPERTQMVSYVIKALGLDDPATICSQ